MVTDRPLPLLIETLNPTSSLKKDLSVVIVETNLMYCFDNSLSVFIGNGVVNLHIWVQMWVDEIKIGVDKKIKMWVETCILNQYSYLN